MASHGCSRDRGARGPGIVSGGNRPFWGVSVENEIDWLDRLDSKPGLGLRVQNERFSKEKRFILRDTEKEV